MRDVQLLDRGGAGGGGPGRRLPGQRPPWCPLGRAAALGGTGAGARRGARARPEGLPAGAAHADLELPARVLVVVDDVVPPADLGEAAEERGEVHRRAPDELVVGPERGALVQVGGRGRRGELAVPHLEQEHALLGAGQPPERAPPRGAAAITSVPEGQVRGVEPAALHADRGGRLHVAVREGRPHGRGGLAPLVGDEDAAVQPVQPPAVRRLV